MKTGLKSFGFGEEIRPLEVKLADFLIEFVEFEGFGLNDLGKLTVPTGQLINFIVQEFVLDFVR